MKSRIVSVIVLAAMVLAARQNYFGPMIEVSEFSCERTSQFHFRVSGLVKNVSERDLSITARIVVDSSDAPKFFSGVVGEGPIAPGESAWFEVRDRLPPAVANDEGGLCRVDAFTDADGDSLRFAVVETAAE